MRLRQLKSVVFPVPFGPISPKIFAGNDFERDIVERPNSPEMHRQAFDLNERSALEIGLFKLFGCSSGGRAILTFVLKTRLRSYSHVKHASDLHPDTGAGGFRLN